MCASLSLLPFALPATSLAQTAASGYQTPPAALQAIVDAPRAPQLLLGPKRNLAALIQTPALPPITEVAQPELKLAGLRINPRTHATSRFTYGSDLWLQDLASGTGTPQPIRIQGLPANLRLADSQFSPDQRYLAFTHMSESALELWLVDLSSHKARRLGNLALNSVHGRGFAWQPDSRSLLVRLRQSGSAPVGNGIPLGPNVQTASPGGGKKQLRTYQDLLKNESDALLYEHYATVQLAMVDLQGKTRAIGKPERFLAAQSSPNGKYLLTVSIDRPYSYVVPEYAFPQRMEIRDLDGKVVHTLARKPLEEGLPPGDDAVSTGPRDLEWRSDAPATVVWAEAQDGGDASKPAEVRDAVMTLAAPFTGQPQVLAKLGSRLRDIKWGRGDLALLEERWHKTRALKLWRLFPDQPQRSAELLREGSSEDQYKDPGQPEMQDDAAGNPRLVVVSDSNGDNLLLNGKGAAPEGARPFLDLYNLASKQSTRLFHSSAPYYERVSEVLDTKGKLLLTRREAPAERPNYYVRDLAKPAEQQLSALTRFPHPTPQLKDMQKEVIQYKRADGVDLNATLYLPANYDAKRDGPLPLLMWAYPQEFKSASAAGQVVDSPYQFNFISPSSAKAFVAMGYAVLDNPSMPIVGVGEQEPNDTYLPQLIASAEAAVNEVVRRGVAERHRIAIGGHSYGAFMTANLLAHTRLFRAGIARSGAYNRTLTPFGFQSEERPFWQAKEVYQNMSPFNYAEKIKDSILFIHGEQDNNPGTFPIQSERMFQAVKGLGGTAKLVMLPNESHGYRARESISHMLYETNAWLDKYVKNAKP